MKKYNSVSVLGTQWGDEGKGKITNYLSQEADYVVRYQGGNNAGHSIKIGEKRYALHLVPSGIFDSTVMNVLANGVVIDPTGLKQELDQLESQGITDYNLKISDRAHIVFPFHIIYDAIQEKIRRNRNIGTTKRGIGPAYADKFDRSGIRVVDLYDDKILKGLIADNISYKNIILEHLEKHEGINIQTEYKEALTKVKTKSEKAYKKLLSALGKNNRLDLEYIYNLALEYRKFLKPFVADTSVLVYEALESGKKVLFEGAQGVLLSLEHGTYPFVTSSEPTSSAIPVGVGLPPWSINKSLGVVKAYSTRVGTGGFPTEFEDEVSQQIRKTGNEYGTTTGRPRRIGWFDAVLIRHASRVSGLTHITVTLLDVLSGVETIKIAIDYIVNKKQTSYVPAGQQEFNNAKPVYIEVPGWTEDITQVKSFDELPVNAKNYLMKIQKVTGVKVGQFSVGPERSQTVDIDKMFE